MNTFVPSKSWYREHSKWLRLLGCSPILLFQGFLLFSIVSWPIYVLVQRNLSAEFGYIDTPPQTQLLETTAVHGAGKASAGGKYLTTLSYDEVRSFYNVEMAEHGWSFSEEFGNDTSSPELEYCKGNNTAKLYYYNPSVWDFNYTFSLKSGISSNCGLRKVRGRLVPLPFDCSVLLLLASLSWMIFGLLIFRATQVMSESEILRLWHELNFKSKIGVLKAGYRDTRILSTAWLVLGFVGTLFGSYKIVMYLSIWILDVLIH